MEAFEVRVSNIIFHLDAEDAQSGNNNTQVIYLHYIQVKEYYNHTKLETN